MKPVGRVGRKNSAKQVFEIEKVKKKNPLLWLFEPFENDPGFYGKRLFGFDAAYLDDRLYVAVKEGKEPWAGLLVCTSHEHHAALRAEFPQLTPHQVSREMALCLVITFRFRSNCR